MKRVGDDDFGFVERRISGPLFEGDPFGESKVKPQPDEVLVASLIWKHRGRGNPVSIARLKDLTGFSERSIKGVVEQLVVCHRMKIGGRREEPVGYFVIEDAEDLRVAVGPYRAQILAMWRRLKVLESARELRELLGQLTLDEKQV